MMSETHAFTAGDFRFPVTVERPIDVPDGAGGTSTTWVVYIPVIWCHMEEWHGDEKYSDNSGGRVRTFKAMRFTTWFRDDIKETDRLRDQTGLLYAVKRVHNLLLRNKFLQLTADAGVEQ